MAQATIVYIGLYDNVGDNRMTSHIWTTDGSQMTYMNWEPSMTTSQLNRCVGLATARDLRWVDIPCWPVYPALCETAPSVSNNYSKIGVSQFFLYFFIFMSCDVSSRSLGRFY